MCKARKGQAGRAALVEKILGTSPNFGLQGGQRDGWATLVGKAVGCRLGREPPSLLVLEGMAFSFESRLGP